VGLIAVVFVAFFSRLLTDELKAWTPWIVDRLIRRAVRQSPENLRERLAEEWASHVNEIPGDIGKLLWAFDYLRASWKMGDSNDHAKLGKKIAVEINEIVEVEEKLAAVPPVGCGSNIFMSNTWMSNTWNTDNAVMAAILFRHQQQSAIRAAANQLFPATTTVSRNPSSAPAAR
jgi:hypothetical protein